MKNWLIPVGQAGKDQSNPGSKQGGVLLACPGTPGHSQIPVPGDDQLQPGWAEQFFWTLHYFGEGVRGLQAPPKWLLSCQMTNPRRGFGWSQFNCFLFCCHTCGGGRHIELYNGSPIFLRHLPLLIGYNTHSKLKFGVLSPLLHPPQRSFFFLLRFHRGVKWSPTLVR